MIASWLDMIALCAVIVFFCAVLRGISGFGFALAAVPLLSLVISPAQAVTLAIVLQFAIGLRDIPKARGKVERAVLNRMVLGALIGTPLGVALLAWANPDWLRLAIALVVCLSLPVMALPKGKGASTEKQGLFFATGAGMSGGLLGGALGMPGPPAILYFLHFAPPAAQMRLSLMAFFFFTAVFALPGLAWLGLLGWPELILAAACLPFMMMGTALGGYLFRFVSDERYRKMAFLILLAMALSAGYRGFVGLL